MRRKSQKLLNPNQPIAKLGLIFIQKFAHQIGAIWRPKPNHEYGIDGELELTDQGVVTGTIIKVAPPISRTGASRASPST